jgi:hypothetical protein
VLGKNKWDNVDGVAVGALTVLKIIEDNELYNSKLD